jgi:hypothetical protein
MPREESRASDTMALGAHGSFQNRLLRPSDTASHGNYRQSRAARTMGVFVAPELSATVKDWYHNRGEALKNNLPCPPRPPAAHMNLVGTGGSARPVCPPARPIALGLGMCLVRPRDSLLLPPGAPLLTLLPPTHFLSALGAPPSRRRRSQWTPAALRPLLLPRPVLAQRIALS